MRVHTCTNFISHNSHMFVQPEALTGSSRMKGGSTTKIILEMIFLLAESGTVHKQAYRYDSYQV